MFKIALLTPLHPQKTGVADYIEEMLPYLRKAFGNEYQIDLFADNCKPNNKDIVSHHKILEMDLYEDVRKDYNITIYQIGNSCFHFKIYKLALKYPGIVVLHDYAIHHMVAAMFLEQMKNDTAYLEEVRYNHGQEARDLAFKRLTNGELGLWETNAVEYPMSRRVISASLGVIVFSQFAKENLERYACDVPIHRVYLHCGGKCEKCSDKERDAARARLNIDVVSDETVIGVFGFVGRAKRPFSILAAVNNLMQQGKKIKLIYVGQLQDDCKDLPKCAERMGLASQIRFTGFTTHEEFQDYLLASDICISLRYPTMGETSGVLMRALSKGKPSIVTNIGTFQEFSDDMVIKIGHGESEIDELTQSIEKLIEDKVFRSKISANSLQYASEHLEIGSTAHSVVQFIKDAIRFNDVKNNEMYQTIKNKIFDVYGGLSHLDDELLDGTTDILEEIFGGME